MHVKQPKQTLDHLSEICNGSNAYSGLQWKWRDHHHILTKVQQFSWWTSKNYSQLLKHVDSSVVSSIDMTWSFSVTTWTSQMQKTRIQVSEFYINVTVSIETPMQCLNTLQENSTNDLMVLVTLQSVNCAQNFNCQSLCSCGWIVTDIPMSHE